MSWEGYIQSLSAPVDGVNIIQDAAICGIDCRTVWASTPGFSHFSAEEVQVLCGDRTKFFSCGPKVKGVKCMLLTDQMEDEKVYSLNLKTVSDADGKKYNVCVGKTAKALIIVQATAGEYGGALSKRMFEIVDYLRKNGM